VDEEWHYIHHEKFGAELYDWRVDPQELDNLAKKPEDVPMVQELTGRVRDLTAKPREIGGKTQQVEVGQ
jgi:hypothetical protein